MRYPEGGLLPWLVAAVLLINGAAYWWFSGQRDLRLAVPVRVTESGPSVPTLMLLREREALNVTPDLARQLSVDSSAERLADIPDALVMGPEIPPNQTPAALPEALPPEALPEIMSPATSDTDQDVLMGPPEPPPVASTAAEVVAPAAPGPEPTSAPEPEPRLSRCVLLGPGATAGEVGRWGAAIAGDAVTLTGTQTVDQEKITGYRVIVPAPSRPEITLAKLKSAGFDGFVTDKDGRSNQISVGLFQVRANAERQRAQLLKQGHAAVILLDREVRKAYWLELRASPAGLRQAKTALARKFSAVRPVWRDCPPGAPNRD